MANDELERVRADRLERLAELATAYGVSIGHMPEEAELFPAERAAAAEMQRRREFAAMYGVNPDYVDFDGKD